MEDQLKCGHTILNNKCKFCKALKNKWATKLESNGFDDQEDSHGNLKQPDERTAAFEDRDKIQHFFRKLDIYLNDIDNPAKIPAKDRKILELYSQGVYVKGENGIAERANLHFNTVYSVIGKYQKIVLALPEPRSDEGEP